MTADLERSIAALFGGPVAVAVLPVNGPHPPLMPQEARAVARAVQTRRDEFTAGRAAARLAMERLGLPPQAVPAAPDRSPVWPDGLTGSISHAGGLCAAVLSRDPLHKLGLDIEDAAPLDADLWPLVLTPDELDRLAQAPADRRGTIAKRIFGIKEAAYKAQFPLTGAVLGCDAGTRSTGGFCPPSRDGHWNNGAATGETVSRSRRNLPDRRTDRQDLFPDDCGHNPACLTQNAQSHQNLKLKRCVSVWFPFHHRVNVAVLWQYECVPVKLFRVFRLLPVNLSASRPPRVSCRLRPRIQGSRRWRRSTRLDRRSRRSGDAPV